MQRLAVAVIAFGILLAFSGQAQAQRSGLGNNDRMFLVYSQLTQQRAAQQLALQQSNLQRQFDQQFGRSPQAFQQPMDPFENYVQQATTGQMQGRQMIPALYAPNRRGGYFGGGHMRYFNPPR